jgi:hypothetical protein
MAPRLVLVLALCGVCGCDATGSVGSDAGPAMHIGRGEPQPEMPVPDRPDPTALAELLAAVPSTEPAPTGPDGGTRIGSETGVEDDGGSPAPLPSPTTSTGGAVHAFGLKFQPLLSSPAIERAARAQIYWRLMQACAGPTGKLPPPESVTLVFTIRADGAVDPTSVAATAANKELEPVAECVMRTFSAAPFVGPAETRGSSAKIEITWPSVD